MKALHPQPCEHVRSRLIPTKHRFPGVVPLRRRPSIPFIRESGLKVIVTGNHAPATAWKQELERWPPQARFSKNAAVDRERLASHRIPPAHLEACRAKYNPPRDKLSVKSTMHRRHAESRYIDHRSTPRLAMCFCYVQFNFDWNICQGREPPPISGNTPTSRAV